MDGGAAAAMMEGALGRGVGRGGWDFGEGSVSIAGRNRAAPLGVVGSEMVPGS